MICVIDKKQMHDNVITGKEYASEVWNYVISMFLTSFNVYFVCGCACFMIYASKLLSGFFGTRSAYFGEDRLATLLCGLARFDLPNRSGRQPFQSHTYARRDISAASFYGCKLLWRSDERVLLPFFNTQPKLCSYELLCRSIEFIFLRYPNLEHW